MAKRMSKQARRKRTVRVILVVIIVLALLVAAVGILRRQVTSQVNADSADQVQTVTVSRGSIRTTVSGSGNLTDEDVQELTLYSSVSLDEVLVEAGDTVQQGDLLATVNMSTVLSAMADIQSQLNTLDKKIAAASGDELDDTIQTAVAGRVMKLYAAKGDDVSTVMYENGALALLSLDGYLAVALETEQLAAADKVTVTDSAGKTYKGTVESVSGGTAVVLISDEKSTYGDTVTVTDAEGAVLGTGELYIHQQLKLTGIAGTVKAVKYSENEKIKAGKTLFTLTDTSFSANYTTLLESRTELEEQLQRLITVYQDGAVLSPISGTVSSVGDSSGSSSQSGYSMMGMSSTGTSSGTEQTLLSICPGTQMNVSISVDETDILSMALGQEATVTVDALSDETVRGTVTEIDTTATSSGGVTVYTVTVTFDKTQGMLSGMTADVSIVIQGVENALLIPSDALTQTRNQSYVYTSYDAETGELGGMVAVTVGMNNGSYVEITGGLSEGDTVYYKEKQSSNGFSFGNMGNMGGFGGNMGGFGGNMGGFSGNMGGMTGGSSGRPDSSERPGGNERPSGNRGQ